MKASRLFMSSLAVLAATAVVASAAPNKPKVFGKRSGPVAPAPPVKAPKVLLFDQTAGTTGVGIVSQDFETPFDAYDAQGALDFVVPGGQTWSIDSAFIPGVYFNGFGPTPQFHFQFFNNGASMPGTPIAACTYNNLVNGVNFTADAIGNVTITTLPAPCVLGPGTYWVSGISRMDFGAGGEWGWLDAANSQGAVGKWQNPGGGFGTGCNTWGDLQTCIAAGEGPDWSIQLNGTIVPVELQDFSIE
jgi:hypothetical protein